MALVVPEAARPEEHRTLITMVEVVLAAAMEAVHTLNMEVEEEVEAAATWATRVEVHFMVGERVVEAGQ